MSQKNWKVVSKIFLFKDTWKIISQRVAHFDCRRFDACTMYLGQTVIAQHPFCNFTVYAAIVAVAGHREADSSLVNTQIQ